MPRAFCGPNDKAIAFFCLIFLYMGRTDAGQATVNKMFSLSMAAWIADMRFSRGAILFISPNQIRVRRQNCIRTDEALPFKG
jgi:hypothetical protein